MKRKHFSITQDEEKKLERRSKVKDMSKSEIVRRALDFYFNKKPLDKDGKELFDQ